MASLIAAALVTVLIDGNPIDGSVAARLHGGIVAVPLAPYLTTIAERIETDSDGGRIVFQRGAHLVAVSIGSPVERSGGATNALPFAPFVRDGETFIPFAAVARGLGANVDFDATTKTVRVGFEPEPLATLEPAAHWTAGPGPFETFAPPATPAPTPRSSGIPKPRRTPVLIEPNEPSLRDAASRPR
jgi:hypothetical protein